VDDNSAAFDGFDAQQDAVWMAEVTKECMKVWSHKRLARNQRMAMQLKNLSRLNKDSRRDIREDAGRIRHQCQSQ
jgi:deoxyribodipyrimidine photolyase-related protein